MAEGQEFLDFFKEDLKRDVENYRKFMKNFDRTQDTFKFPKKGFDVLTKNNDEEIEVELQFIKSSDMYSIRKLDAENKSYERDTKMLVAGIKSWNLVDETGNLLPITKPTMDELPNPLIQILLLLIKAKNLEPTPDEIESLLG